MKHALTVAILETMWSWCGMEADRTPYFHINPDNFTGKRLYRLLDGTKRKLIVTNACPETVERAHHHGTPDPSWLKQNLQELNERYDVRLYLVCGKVAQATLEQADIAMDESQRVIYMPHPAARMWTRHGMAVCNGIIKNGTEDYEITAKGEWSLLKGVIIQ